MVYQFRFDPQSIEIECFKYQHLMSKLTKDRFVKIHRTIRVHLAAQVLSQNSLNVLRDCCVDIKKREGLLLTLL